jgi:ABC-type transporter Mla subunit MlaD
MTSFSSGQHKFYQDRNRVKVKGYTIGRVVEIKPAYEPNLHFLARMRVNNEIAL